MFGEMVRMQMNPAVERPATTVVGSSTRRRDPALDLLRAVALARIVLWHLYAQTWLTWIAAVPVMFFVAGTLIEPARNGYASFVTKRARRLLIPFWVYGAAVGIFTTIVAMKSATGHGFSGASLWSWIVPVTDPTSAAWTSGWLSSHLWYLRAYLWIIVLGPMLVLAARRILLTFGVVAVSVILLEIASAQGLPLLGHGPLRVLLGDALVYGFFACLGIWYRTNGVKISVRVRSLLASLFGGAAITFALMVGLPTGGINASYPAVLLLGIGTLSGLAAIERPLRELASRVGVAAATRRVSSRALTIYLWHPACIVIAAAIIGASGIPAAIARAAITVACVTVAVALVGWVEDLAANGTVGRVAPAKGRVRLATTVAALVAAAAIPVVRSSWVSAAAVRTVNSGTLVSKVPAPSTRLALADSEFVPVVSPVATPVVLPLAARALSSLVPSIAATRVDEDELLFASPMTTNVPTATTPTKARGPQVVTLRSKTTATITTIKIALQRPTTTVPKTATNTNKPTKSVASAPSITVGPAALPADRLQTAFDQWRRQVQPAITSSIVSVRIGTQSWTSRSSDAGVDPRYLASVPFMASSITKTFTAALVMRAVDRGALRLDDPVPTLNGLTVPVPAGVTVRTLLTHTSGLVDYRSANGYDATVPLTAFDAVTLSLRTPLGSVPGSQMTYGNSNYLYLGLLIEQIEGRPYAQLIRELTTSVGLNDTRLDETPRPGWIGFSSGGIVATAADLATWGQALLTPGRVLSERALALMSTIGDANLGLGLWPACPCTTDAQGVKHSTALGHHTADGGMFVFPATGMTVVAMFEPIGHDTDGRIVSLAAALNAAMTTPTS